MIRIWHEGAKPGKSYTFRATREGLFTIIDGNIRLGSAAPVDIRIMCVSSRERHKYPRHVFSLHRHDSTTWYVEAGPHFVQRPGGPLMTINDALELTGVPPDLDLLNLPEAT